MKDLLFCIHVAVKALNLNISRCHLARPKHKYPEKYLKNLSGNSSFFLLKIHPKVSKYSKIFLKIRKYPKVF